MGNYYLSNGSAGAARMYNYLHDVTNGSTKGGAKTFILNDRYSDSVQYAGWDWQPLPSAFWTANNNGKLSNGEHTIRIIIESYVNSSTDDVLYYSYAGANGNGQAQFSLTDYGFVSFDNVGYFLQQNGGTISVDNTKTSGIYAYRRANTPPPTIPEPEPETPGTETDPTVPEPSAFGLLAGLGAIALAASRRRRSRC